MKMLKSHYEKLKSLVIDNIDKVEKCDNLKQYRWNVYHAIPYNENCDFINGLYDYLNDDHIDTALRLIVTTIARDEFLSH